MQNIATSKLSIININNKTSTNPLVRFSVFPSTKSRFLCYFGLRNPRFRAFRAQNRHFCARAEGQVASGSVIAETLSVNVAFLQITARVSKM